MTAACSRGAQPYSITNEPAQTRKDTAMSSWATDDLHAIEANDDLFVSPFRDDGTSYGTTDCCERQSSAGISLSITVVIVGRRIICWSCIVWIYVASAVTTVIAAVIATTTVPTCGCGFHC